MSAVKAFNGISSIAGTLLVGVGVGVALILVDAVKVADDVTLSVAVIVLDEDTLELGEGEALELDEGETLELGEGEALELDEGETLGLELEVGVRLLVDVGLRPEVGLIVLAALLLTLAVDEGDKL